jgi:hypothetical protein
MRTTAALSVACLLFATSSTAATRGWSRGWKGLRGLPHLESTVADGDALLVSGSWSTSAFLAKVSEAGDLAWAKTITPFLRFTTASVNGKFYACGSEDNMYRDRAFVAQFAIDGSLRWGRRIEGASEVRIFGATATPDGGLAIAGAAGQSSFAAKIGAAGEIVWATRFDATGTDRLRTIRQARDGGFIVAGSSDCRALVLRISAEGELRSRHAYGSAGCVQFYDVADTPSGFLAAGFDHTPGDVGVLAAFDKSGNLEWSKELAAGGEDRIWSVGLLPDGSAVFGGITSGFGAGPLSPIALAISPAGKQLWTRVLGKPEETFHQYSFGLSVTAVTRGGRVAIASRGDEMLRLVAFGSSGQVDGCSLSTSPEVPLSAGHLRPSDVRVTATPLDLTTSPLDLTVNEAVLSPAPFCLAADDQLVASAATARARRSADALRKQPAPLTAEQKEIDALATETGALWESSNFEKLDALYVRVMNDPKPLIGAVSKLATFYKALQPVEATVGTSEVGEYQSRIARAEAWIRLRSSSAPARVALMTELYLLLWHDRGAGYNDTVDSDAAERAETSMARGRRVAEEASKVAASDPEYYIALIELGMGNDLEAVVARAERSVKIPYPDLYTRTALFLLPRWGGTPETFVAFAEQAAKATAPSLGDTLYLVFANMIVRDEYWSGSSGPRALTAFTDYRFDWQRLQRAWRDARAHVPPSQYAEYDEQLARMAWQRRDVLVAALIFQELKWDATAKKYWKNQKEFDEVAEWSATGTRASSKLLRKSEGAPLPAGAWPRIAIAVASDSSNVALQQGFLIDDGRGGLLGATVPRKDVQFGGLSPAGERRSSKSQHAIVLPLTARAPLPAGVLPVRTKPFDYAEVFIVACRGVAPCRQEVIAARLSGSTSLDTITLTVHDASAIADDLAGAPVVDLDGALIGVVEARRDRTDRLEASLLAPMLATTAPASPLPFRGRSGGS